MPPGLCIDHLRVLFYITLSAKYTFFFSPKKKKNLCSLQGKWKIKCKEKSLCYFEIVNSFIISYPYISKFLKSWILVMTWYETEMKMYQEKFDWNFDQRATFIYPSHLHCTHAKWYNKWSRGVRLLVWQRCTNREKEMEVVFPSRWSYEEQKKHDKMSFLGKKKKKKKNSNQNFGMRLGWLGIYLSYALIWYMLYFWMTWFNFGGVSAWKGQIFL